MGAGRQATGGQVAWGARSQRVVRAGRGHAAQKQLRVGGGGGGAWAGGAAWAAGGARGGELAGMEAEEDGVE